DAIAEGLRLPERVGLRYLLGQSEADNQMKQIFHDARDADTLRFGLVVGDTAWTSVEGQEELGESRGVANSAPETPHQPARREEGGRVGNRLAGHHPRDAGKHATLEPQPLAGAQ